MAKIWVLDTETKGTGATMVPLEKERADGRAEPVAPWFKAREPAQRRPDAPQEPAPAAPRRFRVVDLMSREVLADDADGRATVDALKAVHSVVDVRISTWDDEAGRWRPLGLGEQKAIWALRDR